MRMSEPQQGQISQRVALLGDQTTQNQKTKKNIMEKEIKLNVEELEERIAPSNANFPPGQFPSGNPAHAPGNSNPNENPP